MFACLPTVETCDPRIPRIFQLECKCHQRIRMLCHKYMGKSFMTPLLRLHSHTNYICIHQFLGCIEQNRTQYNTTQRNGTQQNRTEQNTTQHNTTEESITQHNTTQNNTGKWSPVINLHFRLVSNRVQGFQIAWIRHNQQDSPLKHVVRRASNIICGSLTQSGHLLCAKAHSRFFLTKEWKHGGLLSTVI